MHLEDAIDVVNYSKFEPEKFYFSQISGSMTIADTSNFIVKTIDLKSPERTIPSEKGSFTVYMCINGKALLKMNDGSTCTLETSETVMIPASMDDFMLVPEEEGTLLLEIYMPQLADEPDYYLNYDEPEDEAHGLYKDTSYEGYDENDDEEEDCGCHGHGHGDHHHCHGHHHGESFFKN